MNKLAFKALPAAKFPVDKLINPWRRKIVKINHQQILLFSVTATLLFNVVVLSGFNLFLIGSVYSSLYLSLVPGFFILKLLRLQGISFFELLVYTIGLSIAYLFLVGISTNLLIFLPNILRPLNMLNSLKIFDIYMVPLLLISQIRENVALIYIKFPRITFVHLFFYITSLFFPVLSILGVQLLNNYDINLLIMVFLFSIALYVSLSAIFAKNLEEFCFEIPIYSIAISLLFMFSLRSSYIIGWDVYKEYKVFLLTESHQFWSMQNLQDAYNACLSITILPTLFHYFTRIDNQYIFKALFQCFFAFTPIVIYLLAKRFADRFIAFLSAFFFMSTLDFFREMPALVRQEIAFLFFGLFLLMLFNKQIRPRQKNILFLIFSFSIVLSHYSTAYILLALLVLACIYLQIHKKVAGKFFHVKMEDFTIKPLLVLLVIAFTFLWLGVITKASNDVIKVINATKADITNVNKQTLNTSILAQFTFHNDNDLQVLLVHEINDASNQFSHLKLAFYPKASYKDYNPIIKSEDNLPLIVPAQISNIIYFVGDSVIKVMKFLIILGFITVVILFRKKFFSAEYSVLSIGFAIAQILITSAPALSLFYPIGRLDQQTLFLIALPSILSASWLLRFIPFKPKMITITSLLVLYAIFTNTLISQIVGGQEPEVILNNTGLYYNEIYLHPSELASIRWLYTNNREPAPVFADLGSFEKMSGYNGQAYTSVFWPVFPSVVDKNGYVYCNYANTLYGIGVTDVKGRRMEYNFPNEFLGNNKSLIYNDLHTRIYK